MNKATADTNMPFAPLGITMNSSRAKISPPSKCLTEYNVVMVVEDCRWPISEPHLAYASWTRQASGMTQPKEQVLAKWQSLVSEQQESGQSIGRVLPRAGTA